MMLHPFVTHPAYRFFRFPQFDGSPEQDETCATEQCRWTPLVDVLETQDAFQLVFEVPGVSTSDIDLKIEKDLLTVTGEKKEAAVAEGTKVLRSERTVGKFSRTFNLPREIDATGVTASAEAGILRVTLPKAAESKPRKIEIAGK